MLERVLGRSANDKFNPYGLLCEKQLCNSPKSITLWTKSPGKKYGLTETGTSLEVDTRCLLFLRTWPTKLFLLASKCQVSPTVTVSPVIVPPYFISC